MKKVLRFINNYKITILFILLLLLGIFIRIYKIDLYPSLLNQDEASSAYEAFSILNYGIDRNGMSYPVHLIAWGSGQNILYSILLMPFVNIIKNINLMVRLPMSLISSFTLVVCYLFIIKRYRNKYGLLAFFLIVIMPWHIMKSRWGLESNIFPDLFLYGLILLYNGIENNKNIYYILSSIVFGISIYSYGTSYVFIPVFMFITYLYLFITKKVKFKNIILYFSVTILVSLPMILFVLINYFDLNQIKILGITIPKLYYNRFTTITSVNGNFITNCIYNLKNTFKLIVFQNDNLVYNYIENYGIYYFVSLPFIIYGIIISLKDFKKNNIYKLNIFYLIASLVVCAMVEVNINRINCLWFSLLIFLIIGLFKLIKDNKFYITVFLTYSILFVLFIHTYFSSYQNKFNNNGIEDVYNYVSKINYERLYITNKIHEPYIYYLLYNRVNPNDYLKTRVIENENEMFQKIVSIDNVYFNLGEKINDNEVYIIDKNENIINSCNEKIIGDFKVINCVK